MHIERTVHASARVGEGPVWDSATSELIWVDILGGQVHRSTLDGKTSTVDVATTVGAVAPLVDGGLVAATGQGFAVITEAGDLEPRLNLLPHNHRMNDAKCDSRGRLWAGSTHLDFRAGQGALHVLMPDWTSVVILDGLTLPNGLGWSPDDRTFYLVDSVERTLVAFDFDPDDPAITRMRQLRRFDEEEGLPDGLCIDTDGRLWLAMWGGAKLLVLEPDGTVRSQIPMPVRQPSSCAFGGEALDLLFVTSARDGLDLDDDADDGSVFCISSTGASGVKLAPFAG